MVDDVMPQKRFKWMIMIFDSHKDPLEKIKPVLDYMRSKCWKWEPVLSWDDGALRPRQYLPSEPKKWGFKIIVLVGVSGFVYDFMAYTGRSTFDELCQTRDKEFGLRENVVLLLCRTIRNPIRLYCLLWPFFLNVEVDFTYGRVKWASEVWKP